MKAPRLLAAIPLLFMLAAAPAKAFPEGEATIRMFELLSPLADKRLEAIAWFKQRGKRDAIPPLIQMLRYEQVTETEAQEALKALSGETGNSTWSQWMLWQQGQEDLEPIPGFAAFKGALYSKLDPFFTVFLHDGVKHEIRIEEVVWGGVAKDGIPALTNPKLIPASDAKYMTEKELVFGVSINGDVRAYPLRILDWHEMFNDVVGGVPVSLAYCTLCASGILFETKIEGRDKPLVFGSSGFLFRSNKLMYDTETHSLWNQFTGKPVVGPLTGSGIELKTRPVAITRWGDWVKNNPDTKVLSLDTGYERKYEPGEPYGDYFNSPNLMFPVKVDESQLKAKDYVFALRGSGAEKAWPLSLFEKKRVINDDAGAIPLTLIGNAETRTVRAYRTDGEAFEPGDAPFELKLDGKVWKITEEAITAPGGNKYHRLPGHIAYWFAWNGYLGREGEVATQKN